MTALSRIRAFFLTHKMAPWFWVSLVLLVGVAALAPQQIGVTLYKLALVTSAAWVGYWIDRSLFPYARPDQFGTPPLGCLPNNGSITPDTPVLPLTREQAISFAAAMLRRAGIIGAAMLAVSLGA